MNELELCIVEYRTIVDSIWGIYLDSTTGFQNIKEKIESLQRQISRVMDVSIEYLDNLPISYGNGNPNNPNAVELHRTTQREYKIRNSEGESNYKFIGNMCLISIYQYWEDFYRGNIARLKGIEKNELLCDIMGDLRLLRNSIIHHRGIALKNIESCRILNWYSENDEIFINQEKMEEIIINIHEMLNDLLN